MPDQRVASKSAFARHESTHFKSLGETSAGEFRDVIGKKNTLERQEFIIENLRVKKDLVEA